MVISKFAAKTSFQTEFILALDIEDNACSVVISKRFCGINFKLLELSFNTLKEAQDLHDALYIAMEHNYGAPI